MLKAVFVVCAMQIAKGIIVMEGPVPHGEYTYSYLIQDPSTGDSKSLHEIRQGDLVRGAYSVLDPDGTKRTVYYTADTKDGFKAIVTREPTALPPLHIFNTDPNKYVVFTDFLDSEPVNKVPLQSIFDSDHTEPYLPYHLSQQRKVMKKGRYFTPATELVSLSLNKASFSGVYFKPNH